MIPPFSDDDKEIVIPMGDRNMFLPHLELNHYYIVELEQYVLTPTDNFTLHINWNKGIIPQDKYMKCLVEQFLGKLVRITGVGYDYQNKTDKRTSWQGWLPVEAVKIIQELT